MPHQHVNIVRNARGQFAYVTIGGLNQVKVFRTDNFEQVATIPVGDLPHGIWPSATERASMRAARTAPAPLNRWPPS
jgi:hypothetical protein